MNYILKKIIPMMTENANRMSLDDKVEALEIMIPSMMEYHSLDEKIHIMKESLPIMLKDLEKEELKEMSGVLMPLMIDMMRDKGINVFQMMKMSFLALFKKRNR